MNKLILLIFVASVAHAGMNPFQMAIATCNVEQVKNLLNKKIDPNMLDDSGKPVLRWFATNQACKDARGTATATLLVDHGANFGPEILTSIAFRKMPNTVSYFARKGIGDPSAALKTIARKDDFESIRALLNAGADPLAGDGPTCSLFGATAAGRANSVAEMLKHVKDKNSPKVITAYQLAEKKGEQNIAMLFIDAGVKPPESAMPKKPPCQKQERTPAQSQILTDLGITHPDCKMVGKSGDLMLIECNVAADGPAYYINEKTGKIEATCGGACMGGHCENCPPKGWTDTCVF